jgi:integrase/recombinase XerD
LAEKKGTASTLFVSSRSDSGSYDVSRAGLGEVFERLVQTSGLKVSGRRVHATRHSFATHVLGGGADVTEVSELLGHASVATTQIYLKVDPARLARVTTLMEAGKAAAARMAREGRGRHAEVIAAATAARARAGAGRA